MFSYKSKRKKEIDRELDLYRQEQTLLIDRAVHEKRINNWNDVEVVRSNRMSTIEGIRSDIAKLEEKRDNLTKICDAQNKLLEAKEAEIKRLTESLSLLIKNIPNSCNCGKK